MPALLIIAQIPFGHSVCNINAACVTDSSSKLEINIFQINAKSQKLRRQAISNQLHPIETQSEKDDPNQLSQSHLSNQQKSYKLNKNTLCIHSMFREINPLNIITDNEATFMQIQSNFTTQAIIATSYDYYFTNLTNLDRKSIPSTITTVQAFIHTLNNIVYHLQSVNDDV